MTADVHRHGQSGHMGGGGLDGQAQAGGFPAKPLGADTQGVDLVQQLRLQSGIEGVGVSLVDGPEESVLGQTGHLVEGAADPDAQHCRGTGVGARQAHRLHHEALYALHPVGGLEHPQAAHVLRAEALGSHGDPAPVPRHQPEGDGGGGVVLCVHPAQGITHDGLAQIALAVALADPLMDGRLELALDVDLLAQLHEHAGHAGVLADGQIFFLRQPQVVPQKAQGLPGQGPGLALPGGVQGGHDVPGQSGVGLDAQLGHRLGDGGGPDGTHRHSLFLVGFVPLYQKPGGFSRAAQKNPGGRGTSRRGCASGCSGIEVEGGVDRPDGAVCSGGAAPSQVPDGDEGVVEPALLMAEKDVPEVAVGPVGWILHQGGRDRGGGVGDPAPHPLRTPGDGEGEGGGVVKMA